MEQYLKAGPTLRAIELDLGDILKYELSDGSIRVIRILSTRAILHETSLRENQSRPLVPEFHARTVVRMHCVLSVDGIQVELVRWVGNDRSFYDPWEIAGVRLWFDANAELFGILTENHGGCRPAKDVRLALQECQRSIAPVLLHPWCPLPDRRIRIEDCYDSSDCWLGPYWGADAHAGLDLNHPAGTPIWAPVAFQTHEWFDRVEDGAGNNRWRGICAWPDGSRWILQVHHFIEFLADRDRPVAAGQQLARGAGVAVGSHEHSHFTFALALPGQELESAIRLDPWILFWQMYRDREMARLHEA